MVLASYTAEGNIFNKAIYYWQRMLGLKSYSKCTHTELLIDNMWYSSSNTDGGVRSKRIDSRSGHWRFDYINATAEQEQIVIQFFEKHDGKKYDYCGILCSQVFPFGIHTKSKYFCSEICHEALVKAEVLPGNKPSAWFNPARLAKEIHALNTK